MLSLTYGLWLSGVEVAQGSKRRECLADDDMVNDFDFEQLPSTNEIPRHFDVGFGRRRIATGMIVHQNDRTTRRDDSWAKNLTRVNRAGVKRSQRDEIVADDAFSGVEHQYDERFLGGIEPVSRRDILPPIFRCLLRRINRCGRRCAFTDAHDFEFVGIIHRDQKENAGSS